MNLPFNISPKDTAQIVLNLLAFLILYFAPGGHGSFWGFLTFNITAGIILTEILLTKDKVGVALWSTKVVTYLFLTAKFFHNMGELKGAYVAMIAISATSFIISRKMVKNRRFGLWGQIAAYCIGAYMYITAIISHPGDFNLAHMAFWLVNLISYALLIGQINKEKKSKDNLIIPGYGVFMSAIYILCMAYTYFSS